MLLIDYIAIVDLRSIRNTIFTFLLSPFFLFMNFIQHNY